MSTPHRIRSRWAIIRQFFDSERLAPIVNSTRFEEMSALKDDLARKIDDALSDEQHIAPAPPAPAVSEGDALRAIIGMIESCAGAPTNPDSLPQMILHTARHALIDAAQRDPSFMSASEIVARERAEWEDCSEGQIACDNILAEISTPQVAPAVRGETDGVREALKAARSWFAACQPFAGPGGRYMTAGEMLEVIDAPLTPPALSVRDDVREALVKARDFIEREVAAEHRALDEWREIGGPDWKDDHPAIKRLKRFSEAIAQIDAALSPSQAEE